MALVCCTSISCRCDGSSPGRSAACWTRFRAAQPPGVGVTVVGGVPRLRAGLQAAERPPARSLARSFADAPRSGVKLGSRGEISMDTSVEPITTKGHVQGAGPSCQSAAHQQNRCVKERRRAKGLQYEAGKGVGSRA